jgi:hypothetical protein
MAPPTPDLLFLSFLNPRPGYNGSRSLPYKSQLNTPSLTFFVINTSSQHPESPAPLHAPAPFLQAPACTHQSTP